MKTIDHHIIRSKRKTMSLQITSDARLLVRVPKRTPMWVITRFMNQHTDWIVKNQERMKKRHSSIVSKKFTEGEEFLYLGKSYPLSLIQDIKEEVFFNNRFYVSKDCLLQAKDMFIRWYKEQAFAYISGQASLYASDMNLSYTKIRITHAQKRWGSCSVQNNLSFSWRLIMAPTDVVDYVIVHELAHIKEKNHGKKFWHEVEKIIPAYKKHKRWLKDNGHLCIV